MAKPSYDRQTGYSNVTTFILCFDYVFSEPYNAKIVLNALRPSQLLLTTHDGILIGPIATLLDRVANELVRDAVATAAVVVSGKRTGPVSCSLSARGISRREQ